MTTTFFPRTRLRAGELNELAERAESAHLGGASYLAADNGFEQVARNPRRDERPAAPGAGPKVFLCRTGEMVASAAGNYVTAGSYLSGRVRGATGAIDESDWVDTLLFHCGNGRSGVVEESDLCIGIQAGVETLFCLE